MVRIELDYDPDTGTVSVPTDAISMPLIPKELQHKAIVAAAKSDIARGIPITSVFSSTHTLMVRLAEQEIEKIIHANSQQEKR